MVWFGSISTFRNHDLKFLFMSCWCEVVGSILTNYVFHVTVPWYLFLCLFFFYFFPAYCTSEKRLSNSIYLQVPSSFNSWTFNIVLYSYTHPMYLPWTFLTSKNWLHTIIEVRSIIVFLSQIFQIAHYGEKQCFIQIVL